ncbi:MBOAT-domain-containing protein, partial [Nadsonia fulvescens var. elongata DSM 6958]
MAIEVLDATVKALASDVGLHPDLLKMAMTLLLSYPLCAILKRFPDNAIRAKEIYILSCSVFYLFGIFTLYSGVTTLMIAGMGTYMISFCFPAVSYMPWINFFFIMGHLFKNHISAQFGVANYDTNAIDITGAQMVLAMKLTAFAWNVQDGRLIKKYPNQPGIVTKFQRERAIVERPHILSFLAYVFFFPSLFTGPSYDYIEFKRWLSLEMFDHITKDTSKKHKFHGKRTIPRSGRVALKQFLLGVFWLVLWIKLGKYVSLDYVLGDGSAFVSMPFINKCFYMWALGFTFRLKYYSAWCIAEGSCILCGLGFNGYDKRSGRYLWNRVKNIDPWAFETGQNTHALLEAWNMNTNKWLKNYVYLRVTPKGKKPGFMSTMATFFTSAFWHGTRPGYYLTFITGAFFQAIGKVFRRQLRPIFLSNDGVTAGRFKLLYDIVCYFVVQLAFGYAVQPFVLLDFKPSLWIWKQVGYYVHIGIAIVLFIFYGPFKKKVIRFLKQYHP